MADSELEELRAEAAERGITFDGRWGVERLREALANAEPDEDADDQADEDAEEDAPEGDGKRAGGWVNRDDGAGWVLEDGDD